MRQPPADDDGELAESMLARRRCLTTLVGCGVGDVLLPMVHGLLSASVLSNSEEEMEAVFAAAVEAAEAGDDSAAEGGGAAALSPLTSALQELVLERSSAPGSNNTLDDNLNAAVALVCHLLRHSQLRVCQREGGGKKQKGKGKDLQFNPALSDCKAFIASCTTCLVLEKCSSATAATATQLPPAVSQLLVSVNAACASRLQEGNRLKANITKKTVVAGGSRQGRKAAAATHHEGFEAAEVCDTLTAGLVCSALLQAEEDGGEQQSERACAVLEGVGSFLDLSCLIVEWAHHEGPDGPDTIDISQIRAAWQAVAAGLRQWAAHPELRHHIAAVSGFVVISAAEEATPNVWQRHWSRSPTALGLIGDEIQAILAILQSCG